MEKHKTTEYHPTGPCITHESHATHVTHHSRGVFPVNHLYYSTDNENRTTKR